jgi:hypothetical protein
LDVALSLNTLRYLKRELLNKRHFFLVISTESEISDAIFCHADSTASAPGTIKIKNYQLDSESTALYMYMHKHTHQNCSLWLDYKCTDTFEPAESIVYFSGFDLVERYAFFCNL